MSPVRPIGIISDETVLNFPVTPFGMSPVTPDEISPVAPHGMCPVTPGVDISPARAGMERDPFEICPQREQDCLMRNRLRGLEYMRFLGGLAINELGRPSLR